MDKETIRCPVCGKENRYDYYHEIVGVVERHYYCPRCTYFIEQAYSPVIAGISTDCPEEYIERANELKLDFYQPEEIP